jgi:hypothetical protein
VCHATPNIFKIAISHLSLPVEHYEYLGVIFDRWCATAAQAATVEHKSDRPYKHGSRTAEADLQANLELSSSFFMQKLGNMDVKDSQVL